MRKQAIGAAVLLLVILAGTATVLGLRFVARLPGDGDGVAASADFPDARKKPFGVTYPPARESDSLVWSAAYRPLYGPEISGEWSGEAQGRLRSVYSRVPLAHSPLYAGNEAPPVRPLTTRDLLELNTGDDTSDYFRSYDPAGRMMLHIRYGPDSSTRLKFEVVHAQHGPVRLRFHDHAFMTEAVEYRYIRDSQGRLLEFTPDTGDPDIETAIREYGLTTLKFAYDQQKRLTRISAEVPRSQGGGAPLGDVTFRYDPQGRLMEITDTTGPEPQRTFFRYELNSRRLLTSPFPLSGQPFPSSIENAPDGSTLFAYDAQNRLVRSSARRGDTVDIVEYRRDGLGRVVATPGLTIRPQGTRFRERNFEFDTNGNLLRQVEKNGGVRELLYEYDSHNNWIRRVDVVEGRVNTTERDISYYQDGQDT